MSASLDPAQRAVMTQRIVVYPYTGHDAYGVSSWSTSGSTFMARISYDQRQYRGANDSVVQITHVLWVDSTGNIRQSDRIVLPDGTSPPVMMVMSPVDEAGRVHHVKVILG